MPSSKISLKEQQAFDNALYSGYRHQKTSGTLYRSMLRRGLHPGRKQVFLREFKSRIEQIREDRRLERVSVRYAEKHPVAHRPEPIYKLTPIKYPNRNELLRQIQSGIYKTEFFWSGEPYIATLNKPAVSSYVRTKPWGKRTAYLVPANRETGSQHVRRIQEAGHKNHFQLMLMGDYYNPNKPKDAMNPRYNITSGSLAHNPLSPSLWGAYIGEAIANAMFAGDVGLTSALGGSGWILIHVSKIWVMETVWPL